jgi:hypothetical protein
MVEVHLSWLASSSTCAFPFSVAFSNPIQGKYTNVRCSVVKYRAAVTGKVESCQKEGRKRNDVDGIVFFSMNNGFNSLGS